MTRFCFTPFRAFFLCVDERACVSYFFDVFFVSFLPDGDFVIVNSCMKNMCVSIAQQVCFRACCLCAVSSKFLIQKSRG